MGGSARQYWFAWNGDVAQPYRGVGSWPLDLVSLAVHARAPIRCRWVGPTGRHPLRPLRYTRSHRQRGRHVGHLPLADPLCGHESWLFAPVTDSEYVVGVVVVCWASPATSATPSVAACSPWSNGPVRRSCEP